MKIASVYIPRIEMDVDVDVKHIVDIFEINKIANVSKIYVETYKHCNSIYKRAYIVINYWYNNFASYNFICKLRNPIYQAQLMYKGVICWSVYINNNIGKLSLKKLLTIFEETEMDFGNKNNERQLDNNEDIIYVDRNKSNRLIKF